MQRFDQLLPAGLRSEVEPGAVWSSRCASLCDRIDVNDHRLTMPPLREHLTYCPVALLLAISSTQPDPVGFVVSLGDRVVERLLRVDRTVLAHDVFSRANTRVTLAALLDSQPQGAVL